MKPNRMQLRDLAFFTCRMLTLYLLVVTLGKVSEVFVSLRHTYALVLNATSTTTGGSTGGFGPGSGGLPLVVNNLPQARNISVYIIMALLPVLMYTAVAWQLWVRAPLLAERMVGNQREDFDDTPLRDNATGEEAEADNENSLAAIQERTWDIKRVTFATVGLYLVLMNMSFMFSILLSFLSNLVSFNRTGFTIPFPLTFFSLLSFVQFFVGLGLLLGAPATLKLLHRIRLWSTEKPTWLGKQSA